MKTWHILALALPLVTTSSLAEESKATRNETFDWIKSMLDAHGSVAGKGTTRTPSGAHLPIKIEIAVRWSGREECNAQLSQSVSYKYDSSSPRTQAGKDLRIRMGDLDFDAVRLLPLEQSKLYRLFRDDSIDLDSNAWVLEIGSTPPDKAYTIKDGQGEEYQVSVEIPFLANRKDIAERAVNAWAHAIKLCGGKKPAF